MSNLFACILHKKTSDQYASLLNLAEAYLYEDNMMWICVPLDYEPIDLIIDNSYC